MRATKETICYRIIEKSQQTTLKNVAEFSDATNLFNGNENFSIHFREIFGIKERQEQNGSEE